jgi:hypothetical protein
MKNQWQKNEIPSFDSLKINMKSQNKNDIGKKSSTLL